MALSSASLRRYLACAYLWLACLTTHTRTQFLPSLNSSDLIFVTSPANNNITVSYKTPPIGTCTTVFATQRQYTGYVNIPSDVLGLGQGNYSIHTFFWFIEARQLPETAPLTIFINGGPGSSSMVGLFQEVGPCEVVEIARGKLGTVAREWGWDRSSNIVFIDQPVQVGFSYDTATNASLNLLDELLSYPPTDRPITQPPYTFLNGTFSSGNADFTANTSQVAAESIWHFLQSFLTTFPQYNPGILPLPNGSRSNGSAEINLFTESYGGKFGPAIGARFQEKNFLRDTDPVFANNTIEITLKSLGIINGWIDILTQIPSYPTFAYNNSYGIQAISQVQQLNALSSYNGAGGCQQLTTTCRAQELAYDPEGTGNLAFVNDACAQAQDSCQVNIIGPYSTSGRSVYDISQNLLDPFPNSYYLDYLNTLEVQQAIGVAVNYTQNSLAVYFAFDETGDYARNGVVQDLVNLLNSGVRVALIYGDRDYICNWVGGEAVSYAIAGAAGPSYLPWYSAGYAPIVANESYIGGAVREYGNLSFSRIYDAGHLVPAYQPETAFTVFSRIIDGTDISLGLPANLSTYASFGDSNSTHENLPPAAASPTCFLRAINATCNTDQKNMLANNDGVIINGVLYDSEDQWTAPDPEVTTVAGVPGTAPLSMFTTVPSALPSSTTMTTSTQNSSPSTTTTTRRFPTGVFTATGVPTTTTSSEAVLPKNNVFQDTQPAMFVLGFLSLGALFS